MRCRAAFAFGEALPRVSQGWLRPRRQRRIARGMALESPWPIRLIRTPSFPVSTHDTCEEQASGRLMQRALMNARPRVGSPCAVLPDTVDSMVSRTAPFLTGRPAMR
jgi:hypothetical protein